MGKLLKFGLSVIVIGLAVLAFTGTANATTYNGVAFCNEAAVSSNTPTSATLDAAKAGGTQCASFSASAINFSGDAPGAYNLGGFLSSNGAASGITYLNGFSGSSDINDTLWVFTGTAHFTNGQVFNVEHDDGTNMYVNGANVLSAPGPTPPVVSTFTYSGPTGNFDFQFIFTECCAGAVDYSTTLVPPVVGTTPEPSTLVLMFSGMLGVAGTIRRRRRMLSC
jgi:hypothetical protein